MTSRMMLIYGVVLMLARLNAQQSGSALPVEDPRLYQVFFNFHNTVSLAIQSKKAQDPVGSDKEEKGFAHKLRIKPGELQVVTSIAQGFVKDLAKWQDGLKSYVDQVRSQKQQPDPAVLRQFDQQKQQLVDAAVHRLSTALSRGSWQGLHAYINDEHRLHTKLVIFK